MSKNHVFMWTRSRSLPVPADTASGKPVLVGSLVGVTLTKEGEGGNKDGYATVALDGAFRVNVTTTTARTVGQPVFITPAGVITTTDNTGANPVFGYCLEAKGGAAADVAVEIAQV